MGQSGGAGESQPGTVKFLMDNLGSWQVLLEVSQRWQSGCAPARGEPIELCATSRLAAPPRPLRYRGCRPPTLRQVNPPPDSPGLVCAWRAAVSAGLRCVADRRRSATRKESLSAFDICSIFPATGRLRPLWATATKWQPAAHRARVLCRFLRRHRLAKPDQPGQIRFKRTGKAHRPSHQVDLIWARRGFSRC